MNWSSDASILGSVLTTERYKSLASSDANEIVSSEMNSDHMPPPLALLCLLPPSNKRNTHFVALSNFIETRFYEHLARVPNPLLNAGIPDVRMSTSEPVRYFEDSALLSLSSFLVAEPNDIVGLDIEMGMCHGLCNLPIHISLVNSRGQFLLHAGYCLPFRSLVFKLKLFELFLRIFLLMLLSNMSIQFSIVYVILALSFSVMVLMGIFLLWVFL